MATMPPSPRLSARRISTAYLSDTIRISDHRISDTAPVAAAGTATVVPNQPSTVQLTGQLGNPGTPGQTLTFAVLKGPRNGTLANFHPATGTFTYTPNPDVLGADTVTFQVSDSGPLGSLTSQPAVFTINVAASETGAVRVIDNVLIVTPPPRTDGGTNTILVERNGDNIRVRVNGLIDSNSPAISDIDRIVVYGAKASDRIDVSDDLTQVATLDGGHGGTNTITAGSGSTRLHGWYGQNIMTGGPAKDFLIGRTGHVRFVPSPGNDQLFAGNSRPGRRNGTFLLPPFNFSTRPKPPTGTFYRFVGNRIVPIRTPPTFVQSTNHANVAGQR
jgi:hypothetical protein